MKNKSFGEQLEEKIRENILRDISKSEFLNPYGSRVNIPDTVVQEIWDSINWKEVIENIRPKIQDRICATIIGSMETEAKTDVKKLLSVDGIRQKIKMEIYPKLMEILNHD